MSDYGTVTEPGTVRFERLLPGPIERVWAYLTESDKRGTWLGTGPMDLRVGGRVMLHFKHSTLTSPPEPYPEAYKSMEKGVTYESRITRCDPPRLLGYTWAVEPGREWEVVFELTPVGKDVRLVLTHRNLGSRPAMLSISAGWHTHLGLLAERLAGRVPTTFWSTHERLQGEYEKRLP